MMDIRNLVSHSGKPEIFALTLASHNTGFDWRRNNFDCEVLFQLLQAGRHLVRRSILD